MAHHKRFSLEGGRFIVPTPVGEERNIELVAAYETLSETHRNAPFIEPNGVPNWVADITEYIDKKFNALDCYRPQITVLTGSRSVEAVKAPAKFRGTQAGFGYGEDFQIIRMQS